MPNLTKNALPKSAVGSQFDKAGTIGGSKGAFGSNVCNRRVKLGISRVGLGVESTTWGLHSERPDAPDRNIEIDIHMGVNGRAHL